MALFLIPVAMSRPSLPGADQSITDQRFQDVQPLGIPPTGWQSGEPEGVEIHLVPELP